MSSLYYYGYYDKIRKQIDYELQKLWSSATLNLTIVILCALTRVFVCANCNIQLQASPLFLYIHQIKQYVRYIKIKREELRLRSCSRIKNRSVSY